MVMEKSWNMKNWPKVLCDQTWNFTNFAPKIYKICTCFATTKKLTIHVESLHFLTFYAKCHKYKNKKRDGHGKSRNGHGKVMDKYSVKPWEPCTGFLGSFFFLKYLFFQFYRRGFIFLHSNSKKLHHLLKSGYNCLSCIMLLWSRLSRTSSIQIGLR